MLDVYLLNMSNRIAAVMKVLTIITMIFMPLSFIASVYGMNLRHMPGLDSRWGYPLVLTVMGAIGLLMIFLFRKNAGSSSMTRSPVEDSTERSTPDSSLRSFPFHPCRLLQ